MRAPDLAHAPMVAFTPERGWGVIAERSPQGLWRFEQEDESHEVGEFGREHLFFRVGARSPVASDDGPGRPLAAVRKILGGYRGVIAEAMAATTFVNLLALAASLFSMQVYDRVIPGHSESTLLVLSVGVLLVVIIETGLKLARAKIMDSVVLGLDGTLSRAIFQRLLSVRLDQMPGSVGTLAGQLRGYEQVRSFFTARTMFSLVDVPMAFLFLVVIAFIGSPLIACVPLVAAVVAITLGWVMRRRIESLAAIGAKAANRKTGLLVEAVEGAETIKAGAGGWKFLSAWLEVTSETLRNDLKLQHTSEGLAYASAALQQISYSGVVAIGAIEAINGHITGGAVMACSILASRVIVPVLALPGLLVQQAHAKAALKGLDHLYSLGTDHQGVAAPLAPTVLRGRFDIKEMEFRYPECNSGIKVEQLVIQPGERVGVLGSIGSGKSTFLRTLAGLYRPQKGCVLIDGLDVAQIHRQTLSERIGYLQQDHRLFQGTLRDNLLIGLADPGDDVIHQALQRSGLIDIVASHPRGLQLPIREGGSGLSGGQRQLVAFTRLLLSDSSILLLDEPTASMDDVQERRCLSVLAEEMRPDRTFIVVTHKHSLLPFVSRLIVMANGRVVLDGPRDAVLKRLGHPVAERAPAAPSITQIAPRSARPPNGTSELRVVPAPPVNELN
jgi:ATP-binding cassette subfamily C protein LapB